MKLAWKETPNPADHPDPFEDWCRTCGQHLGYGFQEFHLEDCGEHEGNEKGADRS